MTLNNIVLSEMTATKVAGDWQKIEIRASNCKALSNALVSAVEWRMRSMVVTYEPVVSANSSGYVALLCIANGNYAPADLSDAVRKGCVVKSAAKRFSSNVSLPDNEWGEHTDKSGLVYLSTDKHVEETLGLIKFTITLQMRGMR